MATPDEIARAVATAVANVLSSTQTPAPAPKPKETIAKPPTFDGNKSNYESWKRKIQLYLSSSSFQNATTHETISTIISYIEGPNVSTWVDNYFDEHFTNTTGTWNVTLTILWQNLDEAFKDKNLAKEAQAQIQALRQGEMAADDYFVKFESLLKLAGYAKTDKFIIELLERNVRSEVIDLVYNTEPLPTDYGAWKTKIINLDALRRRRLADKKAMKSNTSWTPRTQPLTSSTPQGQTYGQKRDSTGITYTGGGQPMDVDRNTWNPNPVCRKPGCGKRKYEAGTCNSPWHRPGEKPPVRPPPNQNPRFRQLNWQQDEERQAMIDGMKAWMSADPEGFKQSGFGFGTA